MKRCIFYLPLLWCFDELFLFSCIQKEINLLNQLLLYDTSLNENSIIFCQFKGNKKLGEDILYFIGKFRKASMNQHSLNNYFIIVGYL